MPAPNGSAPDVAAILVAAGSGNRFGRPKQFEEILGEPLYLHVVRRFASISSVARLVLVGREEDWSQLDRGVRALNLEVPCAIIAGGETRQQSVFRGLREVQRAGDVEIALVHDVARVLIQENTIMDVIAASREHGSAIVGIPVVDSMKRVMGNEIVESVPRTNLWRAQTPQAARLPLLIAAFEQAEISGYEGTDESELLERIGERPRIVPGSEANFKVTYPEDIDRVRNILAQG